MKRQYQLARVLIVGLTAAAVIVAVPGAAATNNAAAATARSPLDRDGDGRIGEADVIRRRYRAEAERLGADGAPLAPQPFLERARHAYDRRLGRAGGVRAAGIGGSDWISLGPNNGAGRFTSISVHPDTTGTVLAGAAGGGVWRTTDGGLTWTPLTDGIPNLSVGAVAYAPSDPDIVYLGTGEGGYGIDFIPGIGLLRSDDGGETWSLPTSVVATQFYRIDVDPRDPDTLFAATDQGLLRSETGGSTWSTPISNRPPGASGSSVVTDVVRSPDDADRLYAALWCQGKCPTGYDRVMTSTDNGLSWNKAGNGLPVPDSDWSLNRIGLAIAPTDGGTLYAAINVEGGSSGDPNVEMYKTANGGLSWAKAGTPPPYLGAQGWYDNTLTVSPFQKTRVVGGGVYYVLSNDGGRTYKTKNPYQGTPNLPHVDAHDLRWQGSTLWVANDGGVWKSTDYGETWTDCTSGLITRQYYALAIDPVHRERVLAGAQDNGTNQRNDAGDGSWRDVLGGDGFECAVNPEVPEIRYASIYNTQVFRAIGSSGFRSRMPAFPSGEGTPFITPLTLDPDNPSVVYTGTSRVWRSANGGDDWAPLPTTVEDGQWNSEDVWSIAATKANPSVLMVGKNRDLYRSENGGSTWHVTHFGDNGLPNRRVINVEISPFDADIALACLAATTAPSLYRTTDGGLTWNVANDGLRPFSVQVARWDPTDPSVVYAGTDVGVYRSTDGGVTWQPFGNGLPAVSVHDIRMLDDGSMLRVATHGRGVWGLAIPASGNSPPQVTITSPAEPATAMLGEAVTFTASATDADGDPVTASWLVTDDWQRASGGAGTGTLASSLAHTFTSGGELVAAVTVTDAHGATDSAMIPVTVDDPADRCGTPRKLAPGPFPVLERFNNSAAGRGTEDPGISCVSDSSDDNAGKHDTVWAEFTPAETGRYQVTSCGGADTVLTAWTGPACGPYVQLAGGCNDDDPAEMIHCSTSRTASYLELDLTAGTTYRFMVGSYATSASGTFDLIVDCPECDSRVADRVTTVTAAAHADGKNGTHWATDLDLHNPGMTDVTVYLAFLPEGADNSGAVEATVTVPAGTSVELLDVVRTTFAGNGPGALRLRATGELLVASRTYNTTAGGTYGQFVPAGDPAAAVAPGGSALLAGVQSDASFRANVGIANLSDQAATAVMDLYNAAGSLLAQHPVTLQPFGWLQETDVYAMEGVSGLSDGFVIVRNTSAAATLQVYASVVDNGTGDPTFITPTAPATPGNPVWIAAAAHTKGLEDSLWRTDVELVNTSASDATVTLEFYPADSDNTSHGSRQLFVPAGTAVRLSDVLMLEFSASGAGALRASVSSGAVVITSRTFNQAPNGTLGQFIPARPENAAIAAGASGILLQLRRDADFRSNVGMVNLTGQPIQVTADYYQADGTHLGTRTYDLAPFAFHQHTRAVPGGQDVQGGFVVLGSPTAGALFMAYASVVDNHSQDPTYIPAAQPEE